MLFVGNEFFKEFNINGQLFKRKVFVSVIDEYGLSGKILNHSDLWVNRHYQYDKHGRETYCLTSYTDRELSYECIKEYDFNGNLIHEVAPWGEAYHDYSGNKKVFTKECGGKKQWNSHWYKSWFDYDRRGNLIHSIIRDGEKKPHEFWKVPWYDYTETGKRYDNYSYGYEEWNEYDDNNNLIHSKRSDGYEEWYEYDLKGNILSKTEKDKYGKINKYNLKDKKILKIPGISGPEVLFVDKQFNDNENKIYDKNNRLVYKKDNKGREFFYEYDYYENGNLKCSIEYST